MTTPKPDPATISPPVPLTEVLGLVLRYGALMLRAGGTAFRARQSMAAVARGLGLDELSMQLSLGSIMATGRRGDESATLIREVGPPGVNSRRIRELEALALDLTGLTPDGLAAIETSPPYYSVAQTGAAVAAACGAFAFLNGGTWPVMAAAAVGGGVGQGLRTLLLRRRFNQYVVTALCALVAAGVYGLISVASRYVDLGEPRHAVGLISSVLFLVPGFPLVTALLDLLQHETFAALGRLANVTLHLLTGAVGLSVVIAVVGLSDEPPPPRLISESLLFVLRVAASFAGACGFAIVFNCSPRNVLLVGLLASVGNVLRLVLHDAGLAMPPATFLGALTVGLLTSLARVWRTVPRVVLTVPGVVLMVPGLYAFTTLVLLNEGEILAALRAAVLVGFVVGAMAAGLAAARFVSQPDWLRE